MFIPPKRADIKAQIIADIEGEIGQKTPLLSRAFVRVLAHALSGVAALLYRRILWSYAQIFPETADEASIAYYESRYGIIPSPAVPAVLSLTISGEDGSISPSGTLWTHADTGYVYVQKTPATISSGTATAEAECLTAAADSTLADDVALSLVSPVAGISRAVVADTTREGQDADTLEDRRAQVLERIRRTDEIGTAGWYISKALEVPGIKFARVTKNSANDILVYALTAKTGAARVPNGTLLAEVEGYLNNSNRKPLCALIYAQSTTERAATVTISGLSPADETTKANIAAAIRAYLYAAYPRQYTDEAAPTDVVSIGELWSIVIANGAIATGVSFAISGIGSGLTSYTLPIGEIVALDDVVWA